ncbi:MAG TPA: FecR domain-containing protein [Kofleriaceae bacterium]|jgi:hypothetical protein
MTHDHDCETCRDQAPARASVSSALRSLPIRSREADAVARDRARLLDAAGRLPIRTLPRTAVAGLALAAAAAAVILATRGAAPTRITVETTTARWSRHDEGDTTLVRLDDGSLDVRVAHGTETHRLVVVVPDGEIDDLGTTFRIEVVNGRTAAVAVREGAVILRLVGRAPVFLVAGEKWAPPLLAPVATSAVTTASASPPPSVPPAQKVAPASPRVQRTQPRPAPSPIQPAPPMPSSAGQLAAAVRLFDAGELADATTALRAFVAQHPDDARSEDASYLLVLALDRSGDVAGAKAAARAYLDRYPHGFRRAEVESLAN